MPVISSDLSRRERQALEIIVSNGKATAREIQDELPDPPTYSAVRSILRILTLKGLLSKETIKGRDYYSPKVKPEIFKTKALRHLVERFFANSAFEATCALLGHKDVSLSKAQAEKLTQIIKNSSKP